MRNRKALVYTAESAPLAKALPIISVVISAIALMLSLVAATRMEKL